MSNNVRTKDIVGEVLKSEEGLERDDKDGNSRYVPLVEGEGVSECADEDFTLLNTPSEEMEVSGDLLFPGSHSSESGESPTSLLDRELEDIIQASYRYSITRTIFLSILFSAVWVELG